MKKRLRLFFKFIFYSVKNFFYSNVSVHYTAKIYRRATLRIVSAGSITIGANTEIFDYVMIMTYGGDVQIGSGCSINPFCVLYGHGNLKIGNNVLIAGGCMFIPANHIYSDRQVPINLQGITKKGIVIEDDVWIGHGCSILDGVTVKKGSIIGAGSVVTKDTEEYSISYGIPSRKIKTR